MKLYRNIIIFAIIIAVLGGLLFFVSRYESENNDAQVVGEITEETMFNVYKTESEDIARINIKNSSEEYFLTTDGDKWVLNGDSSIKIKKSSLDSLLFSLSSVSVKKVIAENDENANDFGFNNPLGYAELIFKDGTNAKITVGGKTLDGQDYYIMVPGDNKIYMKNAYGTESLIPFISSLRDLSLVSIDTSDINNITEFYMSKRGSMAVKLKNNVDVNDENADARWRMIKPVTAVMNGQNFADKIVSCFESFNASKVIEDHPKNLADYGLNNPYAEFSISTKDAAFSFKVGDETENFRYITMSGQSAVYLIDKTKLSFLDVSYIDLMSNLIHVEYIKDVNKVTIASQDKKYDMEIKGEGEKAEYFINGKKIHKSSFSKAYQAVIGISLDSLDLSDEPKINNEAYIKYSKKDGTETLVEFLPVNDRNYRVVVNGEGNSVTNKKNLDNALEKVQEIIDNAK